MRYLTLRFEKVTLTLVFVDYKLPQSNLLENAIGISSIVIQMDLDKICDEKLQVCSLYCIFTFVCVRYQLAQSSELVVQQISVVIQKIIVPKSKWSVCFIAQCWSAYLNEYLVILGFVYLLQP